MPPQRENYVLSVLGGVSRGKSSPYLEQDSPPAHCWHPLHRPAPPRYTQHDAGGPVQQPGLRYPHRHPCGPQGRGGAGGCPPHLVSGWCRRAEPIGVRVCDLPGALHDQNPARPLPCEPAGTPVSWSCVIGAGYGLAAAAVATAALHAARPARRRPSGAVLLRSAAHRDGPQRICTWLQQASARGLFGQLCAAQPAALSAEQRSTALRNLQARPRPSGWTALCPATMALVGCISAAA